MRNFLKQTFASLVGSLLGLVVFFGLGTAGVIGLLIATGSKNEGPTVKNKSVLVFDLSRTITDSHSNQTIEEALSGDENDTVSLRTVLNTIDKASKDKRIVALFLDGSRGSSATGLATLKEVRSALLHFQKSGKKIIAYDVDLAKRDYYLMSAANTIVLNPMGVMDLNGLSSQVMFLAGAFEKYGIGVQVTRVGKFKSAVEPYILKQMSPENREQTQVLLNDIWNEFLSETGSSRKLNPQQLQAFADSQGILTASEARQRGLVDKVAYFDEVIADLNRLSGNTDSEDKSFRKISLSTYANAPSKETKERDSNNKVAVIYAEGEIVDGQGGIRNIGGDRFAKQLRQLRLDKNVKAVVLRVNSPGGSAVASDVIQREVRLTQKVKPVIVSMGNVAASGGYWISTYSTRIFAEPNTITGSIGVFGLALNFQKLANNNGISWDVVKTSRFADSNTSSRPKTPEELAISQRIVDQIYDQFLDKVSESRKIPKQKVAEIAQGRVWSGEEALKLGLIDSIGGMDDAIEYAAKQAKLGNDWEMEEYPKSHTLEEQILKKLTGSEGLKNQVKPDPLTVQFQKLQAELSIVKEMNDPMGVYARLPFNLRIE